VETSTVTGQFCLWSADPKYYIYTSSPPVPEIM